MTVSVSLFGSLRTAALFAAAATTAVLAGCSHGNGDANDGLANIPDKGEAVLHIASATAASGDYAGAISLYHKALDRGADKMQAHLGIAEASVALDQPDEAESECKLAQEFAAGRVDPQLCFGRIAMERRQPTEALAYYQVAEAGGVKSALLYNDKGVAYDMLGRHAEAQAIYRAGMALAPDDNALRGNYGLSLAISGRRQEALRLLLPLAVGSTATPRARQNVAFVYGLDGDEARARAFLAPDLDAATINNNLKFYQGARSAAATSATAGSVR